LKKNILLVVNPISGDVDKSKIVLLTKAFGAEINVNVIVFETSPNNDIDRLRFFYYEYLPYRIIVAGGDGTIKMVAEAVENLDVILGILPAGSANGLATDLSLPASIEENLPIVFGNNFMEMDMISINGKKSLHLSDLGLNADLVKNYENSNIRGMWGYALQTYTTLKDLEDPFFATITANNETINCLARMVVIANSKKYGTGVIINPNGKMDDGKFELIIIKSLDLSLFGKIITGNMPIDSEDIEIISTDKATISTNVPVNFQIDGEYIGAETKLEIRILSKQMKVAIAL
jgi:diacylglycerol kinase family enzyme